VSALDHVRENQDLSVLSSISHHELSSENKKSPQSSWKSSWKSPRENADLSILSSINHHELSSNRKKSCSIEELSFNDDSCGRSVFFYCSIEKLLFNKGSRQGDVRGIDTRYRMCCLYRMCSTNSRRGSFRKGINRDFICLVFRKSISGKSVYRDFTAQMCWDIDFWELWDQQGRIWGGRRRRPRDALRYVSRSLLLLTRSICRSPLTYIDFFTVNALGH